MHILCFCQQDGASVIHRHHIFRGIDALFLFTYEASHTLSLYTAWVGFLNHKLIHLTASIVGTQVTETTSMPYLKSHIKTFALFIVRHHRIISYLDGYNRILLLGLDNTCYPETLGKMLVINAPFLAVQTWSIVKRWLDPRTQQKIEVPQ